MRPTFQLEEATVADIHAAISAGSLTVRELIEGCHARCEAYDQGGPKLNAILRRNPGALDDADALDEEFRLTGKLRPLHGIPVLLKDNVETAGLETTAGSVVLQHHVPLRDAWLVKRLRAAGAIVYAKTNLHEFAVWGETVSSLGGQTLNPYDLSRTPGGSSGGTGAAIAANFGVIGIGTDTVNSIRSPASANCLVGLRPTLGLVSRAGIIPFSSTQDTAGPICRTVTDVARTLDMIAGYDPQDAVTALGFRQAPASYLACLDVEGLRGARIGVLESFFGAEAIHAGTNSVIRAAVDQMQQQGASILSVDEPIDSQLLVRENSVHLHELERELGAYLKELPWDCAERDLNQLHASGRYHPGIEANLREALVRAGDRAGYYERLVQRTQLQIRVLNILAQHNLDALVFPHQQRLVVPVGETQVERNGGLAAITGFPGLVVPAGFSPVSDTAPVGVPVGIELVGRPFSEPTLLRLGYAFEQSSRHRKPPASTPPLI